MFIIAGYWRIFLNQGYSRFVMNLNFYVSFLQFLYKKNSLTLITFVQCVKLLPIFETTRAVWVPNHLSSSIFSVFPITLNYDKCFKLRRYVIIHMLNIFAFIFFQPSCSATNIPAGILSLNQVIVTYSFW